MRGRRQDTYESANTSSVRVLKQDTLDFDVESVLKRLGSSGDLKFGSATLYNCGINPVLPGKPGSKSRANYRSGIRLLFTWAEAQGESLITPSESFGQKYLRYLSETKYPGRPSTINMRLTHAHTLFRLLHARGCVDPKKCNPLKDVRLSDLPSGQESNLTKKGM